MPVAQPTYQLPLDLDLPEPDEEKQSPEEAKIRSEAARKALENMYGRIGAPRWIEEYNELVKGGWHWRVAAYIAWASSPKVAREPKTQDDLARIHLGLTSDRAISTWRKRNPAIDEVVRIMQAAPLFKHRAEIFTALVAVAVKPEYKSHNDRKLALELMGDYLPAKKVLASLSKRGDDDDVSALSDDQLQELARALSISEDDHDDHTG
jgi:hypothetical protein